jgi:hypothetical protein
MRVIKGMMLALLSMSFMVQGCALLLVGAGAGAGTYAYVKGELQTTYGASVDRTWNATLSALKDLNMRVEWTKKDVLEGNIEATKPDGTKVKIDLIKAGPDTTTVKIRIGVFGDEEASRLIHRKIADILGIKS